VLPAVRGDLLEQPGRLEEARAEFEQSAVLARNEREQALMRKRAAACTSQARSRFGRT
jgi:predicted RNA polymerase sigma factor